MSKTATSGFTQKKAASVQRNDSSSIAEPYKSNQRYPVGHPLATKSFGAQPKSASGSRERKAASNNARKNVVKEANGTLAVVGSDVQTIQIKKENQRSSTGLQASKPVAQFYSSIPDEEDDEHKESSSAADGADLTEPDNATETDFVGSKNAMNPSS